ncbi:glycosyl hydrolase catalytic core-domain-containing protein [Gloeopeniophorella convolvens]|nr:glycosyl hydrolase catalytic core-domain-containing protein [Gloeopeniophorella convolvens]
MLSAAFVVVSFAWHIAALSVTPRSQATTADVPAGWTSLGCFVDNGDRILIQYSYVTATSMTTEACLNTCASEGYSFAGTEWSQECYCGNTYNGGTPPLAPPTDCNMPCSGNSAEICGGPFRINVYARQTSNSKRGLAWPSDNTFDPAVFEAGGLTTWLYDWGPTNTAKNAEFPFYPMQWNTGGIDSLASVVSQTQPDVVMGFNEPDNAAQANISPADAATYWKQYFNPLKSSGVTLLSPAVNDITWLDSFFSACADGCIVDAIALHWYGGWTDDLEPFIQSAFKYNKPIWLTEFALGWVGGQPTVDNYLQFLPLALQYLDSTPQVAKYSFFGAFHDGNPWQFFNADGTLTALGQLYAEDTTV